MYYNGHAQIRNNETTCLTKKNMFNDLKLGKNCGIWIDIFPYDYVDGVKQTRKIKILRSLSYSKATKDYGRGIKGIVKKNYCFYYYVQQKPHVKEKLRK